MALNSLTSADINESTLTVIQGIGVRRASEYFMGADSVVDVVVPNLGTLRITCGANAQSGSVEWRKEYYANYQNFVAQYGTEGSTPVIDGLVLSFGDVFTAQFPALAADSVGRRAEFQVMTYGSGVVTATASLITRSGGSATTCWFGYEVLSNG